MRVRVIQVSVKPRARISAIEVAGNGTFVAYVKSAPTDGRANAELVAPGRASFRLQQGGRLDQERRLDTHEARENRGRMRDTPQWSNARQRRSMVFVHSSIHDAPWSGERASA